MRIGWLADSVGALRGGAEISSDTLVAAAPPGVEIVMCPPGHIAEDVDMYAILNCTTYDASIIPVLSRRPVVKSVRDQWTFGDDELRSWLLDNAALTVFNSPIHRYWFMYPVNTPVEVVPPPIDLERFRMAARESTEREGVLWLGAMHRHKGVLEAVHWARRHKVVVDFIGNGTCIPGSEKYVHYRGVIPYDDVPQTMARYERFLYLPRVLDGFARTVPEAWAAGCELVTGDMVGSMWWISNRPQDLERGAEMFWGAVKGCVE